MKEPPDWVLLRMAKWETVLDALLSSPQVPFDDALRSQLPNRKGIYAISKRGAPVGEYLHAGRTKTQSLQHRILVQHFTQGGDKARGDLVQKVQDRGHAMDKKGAQAWIRDNCLVQCVEEENDENRKWAEHYILSVLQPIWGH